MRPSDGTASASSASARLQRRSRERDRESSLYEQGNNALYEGRWDRAVNYFTRLADLKGSRADSALYWKSYAQNRLGQRADALSTIAELTKGYPSSRYLKEARALEVEVRGSAGQPVRADAQADEELKILALNGLVNNDPEKAVPIIQGLLAGTGSPRLKGQALFVLAQMNNPRAREVLLGIAKGSSIPELQSRAIQYLGANGGRESRAALAEIYSSSTDVDVKRRILRAFTAAGEKDRLLAAAQTEQNPELRAEAVRQLGAIGANEELWQMYQKETSVDVKRPILSAMQVSGNTARMIEIAKTEKDPDLRRLAVRNLGVMGGRTAGDALIEIYGVEKDPAIRRNVINSLFTQGNATALVALARKEPDITMKTEIVKRLSNMDSHRGEELHGGAAEVGAVMPTPYAFIAGALLSATSLAVGVVAAAQQPRIDNAKLTSQPAGSAFAQSFRALVSNEADVAWIGYAVPVVDSERIMCCFGNDTGWVNGNVVMSDGNACCRACRLEPAADGTSMATRAPGAARSGVVRLEGSDRMIVLFRVANRAVDRIRVFSEDCELDAGGRTVTWLEAVRPADSVALLESLAIPADGRRDRVTDGAVSAIALHGDPAADASLDRLVGVNQPEAVRKKVTFWLGSTRGAHGLTTLRRVAQGGSQRRRPEGCGVRRLTEPGGRCIRCAPGTGAHGRERSHPRRGDLLARAKSRAERHRRDNRAHRAGPGYRGEEARGVCPQSVAERRRRAAPHHCGQEQREPGGAKAGDVLARPVQGSAGRRVLCGSVEVGSRLGSALSPEP